jgi:hypothetical protein
LFPLFIAETIVTDLVKYFFIALTFSSLFYPIVPFEHSFEGWLYAFVIYYLGAQCFISIARLLTCTLVWDESYSHRFPSPLFLFFSFFPLLIGVSSAYGFCGVVIGLTCGVLVLPNDLPSVYYWAYVINPMSYMINGLTLHEFKGRLTGDVRTYPYPSTSPFRAYSRFFSVQDAKKLDELWPQNPWENVIIVFCYYLRTRSHANSHARVQPSRSDRPLCACAQCCVW